MIFNFPICVNILNLSCVAFIIVFPLFLFRIASSWGYDDLYTAWCPWVLADMGLILTAGRSLLRILLKIKFVRHVVCLVIYVEGKVCISHDAIFIVYSPLWCWNVQVNFSCAVLVSLYLSPRDPFLFSVRVSHFYCYFCNILIVCISNIYSV